jgi:hypothetical protein
VESVVCLCHPPEDILVQQLGQGRSNGIEVVDEASVVAGQPEECAHGADRGGHWPGQDDLHHLLVHGLMCILVIVSYVYFYLLEP